MARRRTASSSRRWPGCSMADRPMLVDRKSTRLNSSHLVISYAVFCLKKKKIQQCELLEQRRNVLLVLVDRQNHATFGRLHVAPVSVRRARVHLLFALLYLTH